MLMCGKLYAVLFFQQNNPAIFLLIFIQFSIIFLWKNQYIVLFGDTAATANLHNVVIAVLFFTQVGVIECCNAWYITVLQSAEGLEGDITVPGLSTSDGADDQEFNTLDEPVRETVVSV